MSAAKSKSKSKIEEELEAPDPLRKIYEVVKYPEPVLMQEGAKVTEFGPELEAFVADMFATMYAAQGIGLAAPQIGVSKRIAVIDVSFKEDPQDKLVLINPEVIEKEGKQYEEEGCLSFPDIREKIQRASWVKVRAQNEKGEFFEVEGEELLARALQHEIDHLHGVLFIDRISKLKQDLVKRKIKKLIKNGDWD
ncbi:peptide deformylase [Bryocella elongata]|uniref:Peptide deformylase n=1 Tax=Bryocella elongata TaxID=863522 RepID=A0A1H5ZCB3_9BACT|nr:peptide deformylase [Bryocella elongata]SEG33714.1 peptide deformylase [Bryocella elongata]